MKAIARRLNKLEERLGLKKELFLVVLSDSVKRGLDGDICVDILRDCGFLPVGGTALVDLTQIPGGLNAEETKRFVQENGVSICGSRVCGSGMDGDAEETKRFVQENGVSICGSRVCGSGMDGDAGRSLRSALPAEFKVELDHWKERLATGRLGNEEVR